MRRVSCAITSSSRAVTTSTRNSPRKRTRSTMRDRTSAACSPMPPVNASTSRPPQAAAIAATAAATRCTKTSRASVVASRMSPEPPPDRAASPDSCSNDRSSSSELSRRSRSRYSSAPGSTEPERVAMGTPSSGETPIVVSTERPSRSAARTLARRISASTSASSRHGSWRRGPPCTTRCPTASAASSSSTASDASPRTRCSFRVVDPAFTVSTTTGRDPPMTDDELGLLDAYWRAANYLSVGQIYLLDNPLLREPLRPEHVKPRLLGHWGTTPGLNFLYVHLNRAIRARELDVIYVAGPGHGGPAVVAQAYLEGTYSELYPHVTRDE